MSRRPFFKFYFQDFADGCRKAKMSPEQVGMYVMSLGYIWEDRGSFPDDMSLLGVRTGWGKRLCTRLVRELRASGKLVETGDGRLSNDRMVREIEAFVQVKKAAQEREEKRKSRSKETLYSRSIVALQSDYSGTTNDLFSKNRNNNNAMLGTEAAHTRSQKPEARDSEERNNLGAPKGGAQVISTTRALDPEGSAPSEDQNQTDRLDPFRRPRRLAGPDNDLTGLYGIEFQDGRLRISGGVRDDLQSEFPGVDLDAVCLKAAPKVAASKRPSREFILATIRQYAQFAIEDMAKAKAGSGSFGKSPGKKDFLAGLTSEQRALVEAQRSAKQGAH